MTSTGFQFKQFFIRHDRSAMKVNTDGILLGAVANAENAKQILDLGTGTGLVAIMLAQRLAYSQITALELEPNAYQQAVENVKNCAWRERISVVQGDVQAVNFSQKFDLIVANPPYFEDSLHAKTPERDLARTMNQSHLSWLLQAKKWLTERGKITFILPFGAGEKLIAQPHGLACVERWNIATKANQPAKRMIVSFSPIFKECVERNLTIYNAEHQYTPEFKALTKAFYLKM